MLRTKGIINRETFNKCKIIATIGPSSCDEETLRELIIKGLDVARLNFSHGSHSFHKKNIVKIRNLSKEIGKNVAILQDLQGPKIRCGEFPKGKINILAGKKYYLIDKQEKYEKNKILIDYKNILGNIKKGHKILMDDGMLEFVVLENQENSVLIEAKYNGILKSRKGINFPETKLELPSITEKDKEDMIFGISNKVNVIALSFVQSAKDIVECKDFIASLGAKIPLIAKIEKLSAIDCIEQIASISSGIMIARGDLGVEAKLERIPTLQREIIRAASKYSVPTIVATQMLESMIDNPIPSHSEATDVANAVIEGADCLMLSAETAQGNFPVQTIEEISGIVKNIEKKILLYPDFYSLSHMKDESLEDHKAIAKASCEIADYMNATAIVCLTLTGSIARSISNNRPKTKVIAISPNEEIIYQLTYQWGVYPIHSNVFYKNDTILNELSPLLKENGFVKKNDIVIITAGLPMSQVTKTNTIKISKIE